VGCAAFVVVEGATSNAAVGNMRCHKWFLRTSAAPDGQRPESHGRPDQPNQKDPTV
jgi:hypothetical protein